MQEEEVFNLFLDKLIFTVNLLSSVFIYFILIFRNIHIFFTNSLEYSIYFFLSSYSFIPYIHLQYSHLFLFFMLTSISMSISLIKLSFLNLLQFLLTSDPSRHSVTTAFIITTIPYPISILRNQTSFFPPLYLHL